MFKSQIVIKLCLITILCLSACNSIERRSQLPLKQALPTINNQIKINKLLEKKVVKLDPELVINSAINFTSDSKYLFAVDLPNTIVAMDPLGNHIWKKTLVGSDPITSGPVYYQDKIFLIDPSSKIICMHASDGKLLWETSISSKSLALPAISGELILIHTNDGGVTALNITTGKQVWRVAMVVPNITLLKGSTPACTNNYVVNGFAIGRLSNINKFSGEILWSLDLSTPTGRSELEQMNDITADPVIIDQVVYASSYQGNLVAVQLSSGNLLWQKKLSSYSGILVRGNKLYIPSLDGRIFALERDTGKTIWIQEQLLGRNLSKPIYFNGTVVFGDEDGVLYFLDPQDGSIKGLLLIGKGGISMSPIIKEQNKLQILTNEGYLVILEVL